ncbi:MAG: hypothetical protein GY874_06210 [Desulfobacteraceae bacterium]|nr:hypothetical protein [Desulfobacteraceae bacterium]
MSEPLFINSHDYNRDKVSGYDDNDILAYYWETLSENQRPVAQIDTNGDGVTTSDEILTYYKSVYSPDSGSSGVIDALYANFFLITELSQIFRDSKFASLESRDERTTFKMELLITQLESYQDELKKISENDKLQKVLGWGSVAIAGFALLVSICTAGALVPAIVMLAPSIVSFCATLTVQILEEVDEDGLSSIQQCMAEFFAENIFDGDEAAGAIMAQVVILVAMVVISGGVQGAGYKALKTLSTSKDTLNWYLRVIKNMEIVDSVSTGCTGIYESQIALKESQCNANALRAAADADTTQCSIDYDYAWFLTMHADLSDNATNLSEENVFISDAIQTYYSCNSFKVNAI